jgi:long-chain-fatty-acid--[acyl-carrier-protein] ligase
MRRFGLWIVNIIIRISFWFRYRIEVTGLDKVEAYLKKHPGGALFLPNHVAVLIDPLMVAISMWPKYEARPLIVDYMYKIPIFNSVLRMQRALAVPNVDDPKLRVTRERIDQINAQIVEGLKNGDNFHIYPAGRLKNSPLEIIGGASMVYNVVQMYPEVNIILVRAKGLWGSTFSKAYTGNVTPDIGGTIINGIKHVLKNLLFFTPRRRIVVEFEPAPADFPYHTSRRAFNEWLENWYNAPDGMTPQNGKSPGESFIPISLSMWGPVFPEMKKTSKSELAPTISASVQTTVQEILAKITHQSPSDIQPQQMLGMDLGMDSLELVEAVVELQKKYNIEEFPYHDIVSVEQLMQRTTALCRNS